MAESPAWSKPGPCTKRVTMSGRRRRPRPGRSRGDAPRWGIRLRPRSPVLHRRGRALRRAGASVAGRRCRRRVARTPRLGDGRGLRASGSRAGPLRRDPDDERGRASSRRRPASGAGHSGGEGRAPLGEPETPRRGRAETRRFLDVVLVTVPGPQAAPSPFEAAPELADRAARTQMRPCWALMVAFAPRLEVSWDGAFVRSSPRRGWLATRASPPGPRGTPDPTRLRRLVGRPPRNAPRGGRDRAARSVLEDGRPPAAGPAFERDPALAFALPDPALPETCLYDAGRGIGAAGDWCGGPRVAGSVSSGAALASRVLESPLKGGRVCPTRDAETKNGTPEARIRRRRRDGHLRHLPRAALRAHSPDGRVRHRRGEGEADGGEVRSGGLVPSTTAG